jgi:hypothetical protein
VVLPQKEVHPVDVADEIEERLVRDAFRWAPANLGADLDGKFGQGAANYARQYGCRTLGLKVAGGAHTMQVRVSGMVLKQLPVSDPPYPAIRTVWAIRSSE